MSSEQTVDERILSIDFSAAKFVEENREEISEMLTKIRYTFVMKDRRTFVFDIYFASCAADDIVENCTVVSIPMATLVVGDGKVMMMNGIEKETAAYIMGCARKWKTEHCKKKEESYNFYEEHKRWLEKQPAFTWKPEPKRHDSPQQRALARVERRITESIAERNAGWNLMDACSNHGHWLD